MIPRLRPGDVLRLGALGLRSRRVRSGLSALGVAIGIAALVAVVGISASSRAALLAQLDELGTNLLVVSPGQTFFGDDAELPLPAESMIGRIAPVEASAATRTVPATVRRSDRIPVEETGGIAVVGADADLLPAVAGTVARGRFLDAASEHLPAVVLGSRTATRLGIDTIGVMVWIGDQWWSVIGILAPVALAPELDESAIIGRPAATALLDAGETASRIYVRAHPDRVVAVRAVLARTANPESSEQVDVSRPSDALAAKAAATDALTSLLLALGGVALLVGGIGIANVMVIAVLERRAEIGVMRALGATRRHVRLQFLTESAALAVAGGLIGVAIGIAVTAVYAHGRAWQLAVPAEAVAGGVAAALLMGCVAGLYPAERAARLSPTEALRS